MQRTIGRLRFSPTELLKHILFPALYMIRFCCVSTAYTFPMNLSRFTGLLRYPVFCVIVPFPIMIWHIIRKNDILYGKIMKGRINGLWRNVNQENVGVRQGSSAM